MTRDYQPWDHELGYAGSTDTLILARLLLEIRDLLVELLKKENT